MQARRSSFPGGPIRDVLHAGTAEDVERLHHDAMARRRCPSGRGGSDGAVATGALGNGETENDGGEQGEQRRHDRRLLFKKRPKIVAFPIVSCG
jgi:hypothetical protein